MRRVSKLPEVNDNPTREELLAMMKELEKYPEEAIVRAPEDARKPVNREQQEKIT